ncbi:hypothetical protein DM860_001340 [Cuscuta australis]|uniref:Uncharacterized protein n=1 Tax=Cuscuta australis TaxID=267555 RepID=A0A328DUX0_9ASTE|nr:hypothetical protein DM860_001340 [Cuscuta australis]
MKKNFDQRKAKNLKQEGIGGKLDMKENTKNFYLHKNKHDIIYCAASWKEIQVWKRNCKKNDTKTNKGKPTALPSPHTPGSAWVVGLGGGVALDKYMYISFICYSK